MARREVEVLACQVASNAYASVGRMESTDATNIGVRYTENLESFEELFYASARLHALVQRDCLLLEDTYKKLEALVDDKNISASEVKTQISILSAELGYHLKKAAEES